MEKVRLPKEVAEAIERARNKLGFSDGNILVKVVRRDWESPEMQVLNEFVQSDNDRLTIAKAIVNGYEVEMTPEEKVVELSQEWSLGELNAVSRTLDALGIKISGVNAE